ncbi:cytidine deaminase [Pasteurellaceae bacterium 15-036681]|nr:cytidine deaminase [Pasteurellaceae bacterium 15-036681]
MPTHSNIIQRLEQTCNQSDSMLHKKVLEQLKAQQYQAVFSQQFIQQCQTETGLSVVQIALEMLPLAACYSLAPVSNFYVGAIAIGKSGSFYFGANQEFAHDAMAQTIHAEQSAIAHALMAKESEITDMIVNYTPCGHCRQFMNELNSAKHLNIHLPHSQNNLLHSYLPDAFGPKDLNIKSVLFDPQPHNYFAEGDDVVQAAVKIANHAYAPYSQAISGVALLLDSGQVICGQYAENAAFNPSMLPLQIALNYRRLLGLSDIKVTRVVLAEKQAILSHRKITESLAQHCLGLPIEYIIL